MQKILWTLMGLMLLLSSCSSEEETQSYYPKTGKSSIENRYYGVKRSESSLTKGIAQKRNLWYKDAVITVKFLNDPFGASQEVMEYAKEWGQYASISFKFVTSGNADVRLAFDWNESRYITWSYIGTDCKMVVNQNEATASFAYFDELSAEEQKGDVLRVFGQILGLELEHRHLDFDAGWRNKVQSQWEGDVEDIPWETLKQYVFDPIEQDQVLQTNEYDPLSIMIWPFPRTVATNTGRDFNLKLSEKDIEFIKTLYPREIGDQRLLVELTVDPNSLEFEDPRYNFLFWFMADNDITVDWGDGTIEVIEYEGPFDHQVRILDFYPCGYKPPIADPALRHPLSMYYFYKEKKAYKIKVYGTSLLDLGFSDNVASIDNLNCPELLRLDVYTPTLDLSKSTGLKQLHITSPLIEELDLSNCSALETIWMGGGKITTLDISKNKNLKQLYIWGTPITHLTTSSDNGRMKNLTLEDTPISQNKEALVAFVNSLPVGIDEGDCFGLPTISIYPKASREWVAEICTSKGWQVWDWSR